MSIARALVVVLVGAVIATVGLIAWGAFRWEGATRALFARIDAAQVPPRPAAYDPRELAGLPAPVQRYFRAALREGPPIVAGATIEQRGIFNIGETGSRWIRFTAQQRVVTRRPGYVWDAQIELAPWIEIRVHDAYVAGTGILHPSLLGIWSLGELQGSAQIARDQLMRFLAEAPWYPTALLPSQGVRWEPVDARSARATLADGGVVATLTFRFRDDGLIESVHAEARGRSVGGALVPTPWEGRWSEYEQRDGMRVPREGEVAWLLPEGRKPYWRGRVTSLQYLFAR